ncbi:MAG: galactose-1-epimerase [Rhodobacter sp.]|nr:galactose-1-epimerase [Rhodobacter sp.]
MVQIDDIGNIAGQPVRTVTLTGNHGLALTLMNLGARVTQLWVPDRTGKTADIVLGHDSLDDYLTHGRHMGATCGRFANRIAGGRFTLDGTEVQLDRNEGANQLHGGSDGFDHRLWDIAETSANHATFILTSPAGDMGFPGKVQARCTYRLSGARLMIEMTATTDAPTLVNLAHHSYFNLAGHGSGDVLGHHLQIAARHYLPVDVTNIPTGAVLPVAGTPFDFAEARSIGQTMPGPGGFDHCFCLSAPLADTEGQLLRPCATLHDPASGRRLRLLTNQVGLQVYTGAHFDRTAGKAGAKYGRFAGIALETQGFPDAPNQPQFPSTRLELGQEYHHLMLCDFTPD